MRMWMKPSSSGSPSSPPAAACSPSDSLDCSGDSRSAQHHTSSSIHKRLPSNKLHNTTHQRLPPSARLQVPQRRCWTQHQLPPPHSIPLELSLSLLSDERPRRRRPRPPARCRSPSAPTDCFVAKTRRKTSLPPLLLPPSLPRCEPDAHHLPPRSAPGAPHTRGRGARRRSRGESRRGTAPYRSSAAQETL